MKSEMVNEKNYVQYQGFWTGIPKKQRTHRVVANMRKFEGLYLRISLEIKIMIISGMIKKVKILENKWLNKLKNQVQKPSWYWH